ncbi:MAG: hypothetical protein FJY92_09850, partial [Candidatus Hydrogenedentes bacterium]|nr:hypothetical protein [Candidatus Hydrogenedentota bacterium]
MARLDTPNAAAWPEARDRLKAEWFDCYIGRALDPEGRFEELMASPDAALDKTCRHWDARRAEFQIHTPDARLNALINWTRCTTDYHRQGPGLVLGAQIWQMYSHISTGWYGKQWGGDHETIASMLRFYGALQGKNDRICWIAPSLATYDAENNTPYWVDQVWRHFTWTGDTSFLSDMWPAVRKTVAWQCAEHDPDGDGLFQDWYEYWNCDSNGKGPKSVVPSAMSRRMLECAANIAHVVGDADAENEYRNAAAKTHDAVFRELWREDEGRLGCIGADGLWRGHPQTWEEYLPIMAGLLTPEQGRRAMRWLDAHYGFTPEPGVRLLACSDWYPTRWSVQWVPTGDTCLAVLAGMLCGDVAQWYPYLETAVGSAFRSEFPGINMGIANTGAGGGDREDVDSVDPYTHAVVRGLFGIEPALHVGRLDICPAFPADWTEASITTPDVRYTYKREGDSATFHIVTPKPCIKQVRANLSGAETTTPSEDESTVTVAVGARVAPPEPPKEEPILMTAFKRETKRISHADRARLTLLDLSSACNRTVETMITDRYVYDYSR